MEKQVVILYALTKGYLVDVDRSKVSSFNEELVKFVEEKYPKLLQEIADKKALDDSITQGLDRAIKEHKELFSL